MGGLSSHVLDTASGRPAAGLIVRLERQSGDDQYGEIGGGITDSNGRVGDLLGGAALAKGRYRLVFETGPYFAAKQRETFYPEVVVAFAISAPTEHYHVPLLLSPWGYSTYRGS